MNWCSTTHLFGEYFLRCGISSSISSPLSFLPFFFFLIGICSTYPHLINSCSSCLELYPLSKHRCCFLLPLSLRLLIIALSTTSVTRLMSWVLAEDMTADSGIPFLSVKICLFVPSLLLSVGLFPVIAPLKVTVWIYCLWIAMSS